MVVALSNFARLYILFATFIQFCSWAKTKRLSLIPCLTSSGVAELMGVPFFTIL
jgi:hypothetical protein